MNTITEAFKIKGMICSRCLKVLNDELRATGAKVADIQLGNVVINYDPGKIGRTKIKEIILENEFEIIWDKNSILGEQTKRWVINYIWNPDLQGNLSAFLVKKLNTNYEKLSNNFSRVFGKTIERYGILLKVERTNELIEEVELTFSEFAFALCYQDLSALSSQFKRECGLTMKEYKGLGACNRIPLDEI